MDTNMVQLGVPLVGTAAVPDAVPSSTSKVAAQLATSTVKQPQAQAQVSFSEERTFNAQASDDVRRQNVMQAAEMMAADIYVVGDMKFSIYKDISGQFVTRFTSLRDGAVTYVPEQDMMVYMESRGARRKALLKLDV